MAGLVLDRNALLRGMLVASLIAVPFALLGLGVSDNGLGWAGWVSVIGVMLGLTIGGFLAARDQRVEAPLTHGIITAVGVYVIVQAVGVVKRVITDEDLRWSKYASSLLLAVVAGTIGGLLSSMGTSSRRPS
jgi:putative membrane protein (TIGR04086 family)